MLWLFLYIAANVVFYVIIPFVFLALGATCVNMHFMLSNIFFIVYASRTQKSV